MMMSHVTLTQGWENRREVHRRQWVLAIHWKNWKPIWRPLVWGANTRYKYRYKKEKYKDIYTNMLERLKTHFLFILLFTFRFPKISTYILLGADNLPNNIHGSKCSSRAPRQPRGTLLILFWILVSLKNNNFFYIEIITMLMIVNINIYIFQVQAGPICLQLPGPVCPDQQFDWGECVGLYDGQLLINCQFVNG